MKYSNLKYLLLLSLASLVISHDRLNHECIHDQVKEQSDNYIIDLNLDNGHLRNLQQLQLPRKMKITYDMSYFDSLEKSTQNQIFRDNCEKAIKIAVKFFSDLITIIPKPVSSMKWEDNKLSCGLFNLSKEEKLKEQNSDLHLYIVYSNEPTQGYLAAANSCRQVKLLGATHGFVNFNLGKLMKYNFSDSIIFQDLVGIVTHEMLHVLGFSGSDIPNWVDNNKQPHKNPTTKNMVRGLSVTYVRTPNVLAYAKQYYGCEKIAGMPLENQGTRASMGSHWESSAIMDELMCASISKTRPIFTRFTAALLRDTGYYFSINEQLEEESFFGKGEGCPFIQGQCDISKREFCEEGTKENLCDYYNHGSGSCIASTFDDKGCANYTPSIDSRCFDSRNHYMNNPEDIKNHGLTFGANTKCFNSNLFNQNSTGLFDTLQGLCYKFECNMANQVIIEVGSERLVCSKNGEKLTVPGYHGYLMCPEKLEEFCDYQKYCPGHCSTNGYCAKGKCICIDEYSGSSCNQRV